VELRRSVSSRSGVLTFAAAVPSRVPVTWICSSSVGFVNVSSVLFYTGGSYRTTIILLRWFHSSCLRCVVSLALLLRQVVCVLRCYRWWENVAGPHGSRADCAERRAYVVYVVRHWSPQRTPQRTTCRRACGGRATARPCQRYCGACHSAW